MDRQWCGFVSALKAITSSRILSGCSRGTSRLPCSSRILRRAVAPPSLQWLFATSCVRLVRA
eukprot:7091242-Karenia_brevis.AAC.1